MSAYQALVIRLLFVVNVNICEALAGGNKFFEWSVVILRPALFAGRRIYATRRQHRWRPRFA
jgi:uncharacterized membrane protein